MVECIKCKWTFKSIYDSRSICGYCKSYQILEGEWPPKIYGGRQEEIMDDVNDQQQKDIVHDFRRHKELNGRT